MSKRRSSYKKKRNISKLNLDMDSNIFERLAKIPPQHFTTKKDFLSQNIVPACPIVPPKLRRCYGKCSLLTETYGEAQLLKFDPDNQAQLSSWYRRDVQETYFDQVYYRKLKIGEGSFGSVYKAICRDDDKLYAIKHFNGNHPKSSKYIEVENMGKVGIHENILRFFMAWEEGENVYIKMECCQMSLAQYSKINHNIHEDQLHEILHDVIQGLVYLHSKNFVHLDVKPDNILIDRGHYKLGDFGLLYHIKLTNKNDRMSSEGDAKYLAPEVLGGVYTCKADIFALGVTLVELATDYIMPSNGYLWHAMREGQIPSILPEKISLRFLTLIYRMMSYNNENRPSASQIMECPIVADVMTRDALNERTDYARLISIGGLSYPNILNADLRRVLSDIADGPGDMFQTPVNRTVTRKIGFSPSGDCIPRRINPKTGTPTKEFRRSPRVKLFL
ncbi:membrane-associated tyrosine- and threonine-specific cdc2-inhibitory kinase wee-1.3 [Coccinella septempunctata]|uniref:membrane-associated tyrosine- and threonine-specific cdc2-inhibitory kinase wee-1.3 n=1 Tax=Coccinella septempunctata TaxID=41139 RepID=UPI001D06908B|nr:membrane-associated tyrosine- and threonine-specific cdc2-inhibitory kinase wee-1.3 [Coccinella septempunctata]XP_044765965.1 membrane-associated tyrosine- and threonine-specific cdc2-inhibitory kinase wee-1.3 [Coccinella septempunctata]